MSEIYNNSSEDKPQTNLLTMVRAAVVWVPTAFCCFRKSSVFSLV